MKIILASNSPRRKELLNQLGLDFEVRVMKGIDESYPENLPSKDVAKTSVAKLVNLSEEAIKNVVHVI